MRTLAELPKLGIQEAAERFGARNVGVFGSIAHGSASDGSDLDLLVDLEPGRSLLDLVGLKLELEDRPGCRVDVLTPDALSPYIRDHVLADAIPYNP